MPLLDHVLGLRPAAPSAGRLRARVGGRLVVVTGASRGVGAETAARLALAGARVVLLARSVDSLDAVARGIRRRGGSAEVLVVDLGDPVAAERSGDEILDRWGAPEVVVSNAGRSLRRTALDSRDRPQDVDRTIGVNYTGPAALLRRLLPAMVDAGTGHVVSIASTSVDIPAPGWSLYGASKSAMDAWLRAVALELAPSGVAVTSIRLPLVRTAMSAPTAAYAAVPSMRPVDAAKYIARAIVDRPLVLSPWWSRLASAALAVHPRLLDPALRGWDRMIERG
ncbi:SDR family NAD(P)-dependent oxidoreductase [Pseudolysinimonas sp.]|jgi:short-subunit dehydrogenase|uniref:SDR family NAD(P)-dependent oxidoreductase n=1 Tax=Pseudolysinimonas sp. TaxID=2680009 RepID=UPI003784E435